MPYISVFWKYVLSDYQYVFLHCFGICSDRFFTTHYCTFVAIKREHDINILIFEVKPKVHITQKRTVFYNVRMWEKTFIQQDIS